MAGRIAAAAPGIDIVGPWPICGYDG